MDEDNDERTGAMLEWTFELLSERGYFETFAPLREGEEHETTL